MDKELTAQVIKALELAAQAGTGPFELVAKAIVKGAALDSKDTVSTKVAEAGIYAALNLDNRTYDPVKVMSRSKQALLDCSEKGPQLMACHLEALLHDLKLGISR